MQNYDELVSFTSGNPRQAVVVAAALNLHALQAVHAAAQKGHADYLLTGPKKAILEMADKAGLALDEKAIFDAPNDAEAAEKAVALVRSGQGHFLMKGGLGTATLLRAVLNRENGLREEGIMSHVMVHQVPSYNKLLAVTDGAMVPYPTFEQKKAILNNALSLLRALQYDRPIVSVLAAVETLSDKMPETGEAAQLKQLAEEGEFGSCLLDGPLSYDLTMSPSAAQIKGVESPVTGKADLLLVPNIACGNVLSKCLVVSAGGMAAGCIMGAKVPIVLTSRGASAKEKEISILLAAASAAAR